MKSRRSDLQPLIMGVTILIMTYSPCVSAQNHTLLIQRQTTIASRVNYIGLNINYSCTLTYLLSTPRIDEVEVDISFSGPGIRDNSSNVQLSEVIFFRSGNRFQRLLEFHPMSAQDEGIYHCNATIMSANMVLIRTPQQTREIQVFKPTIDISLDPVYPVADRYLDIAPYNSFSFNCSAMITVPGISVNLHRVFSWQRTIEGSLSNISSELFTGSQSSTIGSSILSINATEAGIHTYTCTVTLDVSPAPDIITSNSSRTRTIIGASNPAMPMNVRISRESLLHNRSTVQWLMSSITYDPENYVVQYGLSESNLNMSSSPITSGPNITRVNFLLSEELSDLMAGTTYYYRVTASNSAGITSSVTHFFKTMSIHENFMAMRNVNVGSIVGPILAVIVVIIGVIVIIIILWCYRKTVISKKGKMDLGNYIDVHQDALSQGGITKVKVEELSRPLLTSNRVKGPWGIAVNKEGEIIVADNKANSLRIFTSTGKPIFVNGLGFCICALKNKLKNPCEVAIDASGDILVADRSNHCVKKFQVDDWHLSLVHSFTNKNNQDPNKYWPTGISIFDNKVYVTDTINGHVNILKENLEFENSFGRTGSNNGEFIHPTSVACGKDGKIYVVDNGNNRVQIFNPNGTFKSKFGKSGDGEGQFNRPISITIDQSNDMLYISDRGNKRISMFKTDGQFVASFRSEVCQDFDPCGLTVGENGKLYVCESKKERVLLFKITI